MKKIHYILNKALLMLILLAGFFAAFPGSAFAGRGTYRFEMSLNYDGMSRRPYVHEVILDRRGKADFEFNKKKFLEKELQKAQEELAVKKGYIPQVYGKDYYKLVRVTTWEYKIIDIQTDKVVLQGKGR